LRAVAAFLAAALVAAMALASPSSAVAAEKHTPGSKSQIEYSYAPLVKRSAPAVVNVYSRKIARKRQFSPLFDDPFFRRFFGEGFGMGFGRPRQRIQNSLGSGVIVGAEGLIVTNNHVIEGADEITIVLADRREFEAVIVGTDERTDLAVLRIDTGGEPLPFLEFHDSDELEVGDLVLAIGNPFGVGQTVTGGIVSALARTQVGISDLNSFIQTDAAINPGNSGGALIAMDGRLVGINTAIFSKTGGSMGIGFAIPSNMVRLVIRGVTGNGSVVRPWLGAFGQGVTSDIAASLGMRRPGGILISEVYPDGPAERGGLSVGDVVLAVNSREITDPQSLRYRVATLIIGGTAELTVLRQGSEVKLQIAVEVPPEVPARDTTILMGQQPLAGATVANMSPALGEELGVADIRRGVIILELQRGSAAHRLNFRPGDTIVVLQGEEVKSAAHLKSLVAVPSSKWQVTIKRAGKTHNLIFN
jgi:serine protease Do